MRRCKSHVKEVSRKPLKLDTGSLFQPIERFLKLTDIVRKLGINITRGLDHVNSLFEMTMEESILHIKLL